MLYVLEFPKNEDRPVWTYVTLGMSAEYMTNGAKGELIWLNANQNDEMIDLLAGLAHYPFIDETSFDYGDTISNADAESNFSMNVLLVSPAVIEAGESPELMEFLKKKSLIYFGYCLFIKKRKSICWNREILVRSLTFGWKKRLIQKLSVIQIVYLRFDKNILNNNCE